MPRHTQPQMHTTRIEVHIPLDVLTTVKRAAEIEGRSISDFIMAAARDAAESLIKEEAPIISLSPTDQERIADALAHPPKPNAALNRALAAHRKLITAT